MAVTPNFGWPTPNDSDDANQGAAAIRALGDAVDGVVGGGFLFQQTVYFASSGSFVKANFPGLRAIRVRMVGGGGGGGGAPITSAGQVSMGGGGSGGEYREVFITDISGLDASVTVTRGAGGAGSAGISGTAGGKSIFGSVEAEGGGRGVSVAAGAVPRVTPFSDVGGSGGAGSADLSVPGQRGQAGHAVVAGLVVSGRGGDSRLGFGGPSVAALSFSTGLGAAGFGSGGGGAMNTENNATARSGANGAAGIVIIDCFV
jgi:hypothetical protein